MGSLQISLFGSPQITWDGRAATPRATHTVQGLLAFLVLERQRCHSRDVLAALFWGDYSDARAGKCLSTALWRLRRILEPDGVPHGTYLVTTSAGEVGFNRESDYWLDVGVFEEQAVRLLSRPAESLDVSDAVAFEQTLGLYRADLLEGYYDDWALRERERMRDLHLTSLAHLMRAYRARGALEHSIACGRQILQADPLREDLHREMMRLYVANGQRAEAVRQYEACRDTLARELRISPMEETRALFARIRRGGAVDGEVDEAAERVSLRAMARQLADTLLSLEQAHHQIRSTLETVEKLLTRSDGEPT